MDGTAVTKGEFVERVIGMGFAPPLGVQYMAARWTYKWNDKFFYEIFSTVHDNYGVQDSIHLDDIKLNFIVNQIR